MPFQTAFYTLSSQSPSSDRQTGAIIIEPSGDDGAESVDEKRGFVVACLVVPLSFETRAEPLGIGFYIVKHPGKVPVNN